MAKRQSKFAWAETHDTHFRALYCDEEYIESIIALHGVIEVWQYPFRNSYTVAFDPRYDEDEVKAEIERIIMGDNNG